METPSRVDRYEIKGTLGQGAMGNVYLAWDPKLHRDVALKVLSEAVGTNPKVRSRFHREARAIAALRHPNIVEIYDYSGEESDELFLVMERLHGDDLFNVVADKGVMPEVVATAIGLELCAALQVAHEAGIIHRDLKPENVFMCDGGRVVLTDFGVVKAIREKSVVDGWSQETDIIGTPGFMAPELMANNNLGPTIDVFAMGALLYNISTGEMPFEGPTPVDTFRLVMSEKMSDPRVFAGDLSDEFIFILRACLRAKPKNRFATVEELRARLKQLLEWHGVGDARDDLEAYLEDPISYRETSRQRQVAHVVQQMKIAVKDRDEEWANQWRDRLEVLDPDHPEILATGDADGDGSTPPQIARSVTPPVHTPAVRRSMPWGTFAVAALLLGLGAGGWWLGPRLWLPVEDAPEVIPEDQPAKLIVQVKGANAMVWLNGKRKGRFAKKAFTLEPGEHRVEIKAKKRRFKRVIDIGPGQSKLVDADFKRGTVRIRNAAPEGKAKD